MSRKKSARWPGPTRFVLPMRYQRRAPEKSCGGCCAKSLPAAQLRAMLRRSKIFRCWKNCGLKKNRPKLGHSTVFELLLPDGEGSSQPQKSSANFLFPCIMGRLPPDSVQGVKAQCPRALLSIADLA